MSVNFNTNLGELAEMIGAYMGVAEGLSQKNYMAQMLENAHAKAATEFNVAAATLAKERNFTHMYDFNVRGLTRGDGRILDPTSKRARLWTHVLLGGGGQRTATYVYRPSAQYVPPHDATSAPGVKQEVLDKLAVNKGKKYRFKQKGIVYETGMTVNILPKDAKRLFVPTTKSEKGYVWAKQQTFSPGNSTASTGNFSGFFFEWWSTVGNASMANSMRAKVERDLRKAEVNIQVAASGALRPAATTNIKASVAKGLNKTRKQWTFWVEEKSIHGDTKDVAL